MADPYQSSIDQVNAQYDAQLKKLQEARDRAQGGIDTSYNDARNMIGALTHDVNLSNQASAKGIANTFGQAVTQNQDLLSQIRRDLGQYGAYTPALADEAALRTQAIRDAQTAQASLSQRLAQMADNGMSERQAYSKQLQQGATGQLADIFTNNQSAINLAKQNAIAQLMAQIAAARRAGGGGGGGGYGGGSGGSGGPTDSQIWDRYKAVQGEMGSGLDRESLLKLASGFGGHGVFGDYGGWNPNATQQARQVANSYLNMIANGGDARKAQADFNRWAQRFGNNRLVGGAPFDMGPISQWLNAVVQKQASNAARSKSNQRAWESVFYH